MKYSELRDLPVGARFMFYADDLMRRGPCVLVDKTGGRASISYERAQPTERHFTARDDHGQLVERTIIERTGTEPCSLGAQVIALPVKAMNRDALDALRRGMLDVAEYAGARPTPPSKLAAASGRRQGADVGLHERAPRGGNGLH